MKITDISIPKSFLTNGIEDINMHRLGKIVLIAGKNGSGKTRILTKIQNALNSKPTYTNLELSKRNYKTYVDAIINNEKQITLLKHAIKSSNYLANQIDEFEREIKQLEANVTSFRSNLSQTEKVINWNYIITDDESSKKYSVVPFVPQSGTLKDPSALNKLQLIDSSNKVDFVGMANLPAGALAKIQNTQDRWFHATHQETTISPIEKAEIIRKYEMLKNYIKLFLNTEISRNADGEATLFGFSLGKANLSEGQKILIQLCIAIYSQDKDLSELILFLDEPENHLHPCVIIETLDRLVKCVPKGQIWISTHSVSLLAHFDPSNIWYIENGKISFAGNIPEKVLHSLLGDDAEIEKLRDFINLPNQFAINRFAYECLFHPISLNTDRNDPQSQQINKELELINAKHKIKILDYGTGKGRLLANLYENFDKDLNLINKRFEYVAFDKFDSDKIECENIIKTVYGETKNKYFNDGQKLLTYHDKESFDVIIMCNVLHEIDPNDWLTLFSKKGFISSLLKKEGVLLIIEDNLMPIGEKAYQKGFIVLNTPQIKELFKIQNSNEDDFKVADERGDDRLKAHKIGKKFLSNVTAATRIKALKSLQTIAQEKIIEIRKAEKSYKNGKIHAFWIQQFANVSLALSELINSA